MLRMFICKKVIDVSFDQTCMMIDQSIDRLQHDRLIENTNVIIIVLDLVTRDEMIAF